MDLKLKLISNLITKLNAYMNVVNDIVNEINSIIHGNKNINLYIRNSLKSLRDSSKNINDKDYNNMNYNTFLDISEKEEYNSANNKTTVIFKKFGKEQNYVYDSNTPIKKIIRNYLEDSGSLRMPKKPIFLYKGSSLNPNDMRKIGDITKDELEINVDYF